MHLQPLSYFRWDLVEILLVSFGHYQSAQQQSNRAGEYRAIAKLDIEKGLDRLSDDYRAALVLVTMAGHNYQEAAVILDIPVGTVASRVARAKAMLADYLHSTEKQNQETIEYVRLSDEQNR